MTRCKLCFIIQIFLHYLVKISNIGMLLPKQGVLVFHFSGNDHFAVMFLISFENDYSLMGMMMRNDDLWYGESGEL